VHRGWAVVILQASDGLYERVMTYLKDNACEDVEWHQQAWDEVQ